MNDSVKKEIGEQELEKISGGSVSESFSCDSFQFAFPTGTYRRAFGKTCKYCFNYSPAGVNEYGKPSDFGSCSLGKTM